MFLDQFAAKNKKCVKRIWVSSMSVLFSIHYKLETPQRRGMRPHKYTFMLRSTTQPKVCGGIIGCHVAQYRAVESLWWEIYAAK